MLKCSLPHCDSQPVAAGMAWNDKGTGLVLIRTCGSHEYLLTRKVALK